MFDFPNIYKYVDKLSNQNQFLYMISLFSYYLITIMVSVLDLYFQNNNILAKILFIIIISFLFLFNYYDFQGFWYSARAAAESIKTCTWRYAVKALPYNTYSNDEAKKILTETINEIIKSNQFFPLKYNKIISYVVIPSSLQSFRNKPLEERYNYYLKNRFHEQKKWYSNKSIHNEETSKKLFIISCLVSILILLFIFIDTNNSLPIQPFLVLLTSIFSWNQIKRYKELKRSYELTSHEIAFIEEKLSNIMLTEEGFSNFVCEAEKAFSREHIQWIAKGINVENL